MLRVSIVSIYKWFNAKVSVDFEIFFSLGIKILSLIRLVSLDDRYEGAKIDQFSSEIMCVKYT